MLKTGRFLAIVTVAAAARRTCRLGRADDLSCRAASGRLPGHQRGLFLLVGSTGANTAGSAAAAITAADATL